MAFGISTRAPSSHWGVIRPAPSPDFPEGFGARWLSSQKLYIDRFLDQYGSRVDELLQRFGVLVFPNTALTQPQEHFPLKSKFHGFHVDGANKTIDKDRWSASHLKFNPDSPDTDPTHFAPTLPLLSAARRFVPAYQNLEDQDALNRLHCGEGSELKRIFDRCQFGYAHSWKLLPNSSVIYFADSRAEADRVLHARLTPGPSTAPVARLHSYLIGEEVLTGSKAKEAAAV